MKKYFKIKPITIIMRNNAGKVLKEKTVGPFIFRKERLEKRRGRGYNPNTYRCYYLVCQKTNRQVGHINITKQEDCEWSVSHSWLDENLKGIGIGKKMYQHVIDSVGLLQSDPGGCTSDEAAAVWKSFKAKIIITTRDGGSVVKRYQVVSKIKPPKNYKEQSQWTIFASNMMSWWKQVRSIPKRSLSKIGLSTAFQKRPTAPWI